MPYSLYTDVQSEFKSLSLSATSAVTINEVTEFISQADAKIDAQLSIRYATPITGTEALKLVKKISIDFVAYRVAKILDLKNDVPLPDNRVIQVLSNGGAYKESKLFLEALANGKVPLPDAALNSPGPVVSSYNADNNILPIFERDTKQW